MSPRIKRPRIELPKAMLQKGKVGGLPIHAESLSLLEKKLCACLIGFRDTEETLVYKSRRQIQTCQNEPFELTGKIFNGCSDALYRGQLPEVLLVMPTELQRIDFLNDLTEYVEQLLALGFFVKLPNQIEQDPVSMCVPCFLLMGTGLWFSRFITAFSLFLKDMEHQYPILTPHMQQNILGRFLRGVEQTADLKMIKIAGGNVKSQQSVISALSQQGIKAEVGLPKNQNNTERLEFESALSRLMQIKLPAATIQQLQGSIFSLGQKRKAFLPDEELQTLPGISLKKKLPSGTDIHLLQDLSLYAQAMHLNTEKQLFSDLANQIQENL